MSYHELSVEERSNIQIGLLRGWAPNCSSTLAARAFRRSSPRSAVRISSSAQLVDAPLHSLGKTTMVTELVYNGERGSVGAIKKQRFPKRLTGPALYVGMYCHISPDNELLHARAETLL